MAGLSDIEWTDATWNPIAGCSMVSLGCTNCYAIRMAARLQAMGHTKYRGTTRQSGGRSVWTGRVNLDQASLRVPETWRSPRRIFVNSMSDLFQESVPGAFIRKVWNVMARADWHTYQILTKRPERMKQIIETLALPALPHVWLGTTVENADHIARIDELRNTAAAIRFISFEPLLGPIGPVDMSGIHWAIVGGESGPCARPIEPAWVVELRDLCRAQCVAFFFKQWGGVNKKATGRILDGRTFDEYPEVAHPA